MNERNTNRSRRTPNSRTTQRHQIDGRPAPRRQASQPDYLHGSPQSAPRSQHQPERSRQSRSRAQQQNRPRAQQRARRKGPTSANLALRSTPLLDAARTRLHTLRSACRCTSSIHTKRSIPAKARALMCATAIRRNAAAFPTLSAERRCWCWPFSW